jgi:hypothetical protein
MRYLWTSNEFVLSSIDIERVCAEIEVLRVRWECNIGFSMHGYDEAQKI